MISVLERLYSWAVLAYCSVTGLRGWKRALKASKVRRRVRGVALVVAFLIALHVTERALVRRVIVVVVCWWNLNDAGRAKLGGERRS